MPSSRFRSALTALLFSLSLSDPIAAQAIRGTVTALETGRPIGGAVVQLVGGDGDVGSRALTDGSGSFALAAPSAGRFQVRVERIGFASELSGWLDLGAGEVREHPMAIRSRPITLDGITVRARTRGCSIGENAETVARVWEEARKALAAVALTQSSALVHFDAESFRRELDPVTRAVRAEQRRSTFDHSSNPFVSVPVDELRERGYVRAFPDSTIYYAPDASVLLSDAFLDTHCFRIAAGSGGDAGSLGLEFRPRGRIERPDIEGTLWVDRRLSALRAVDYRYVGRQLDLTGDRFGGRIEFERVEPSGAWIVRRWVIRMPVLTQRTTRFSNPVTKAPEEHVETTITGLVEEGGEVVAINGPRARGSSAGRGEISGSVSDSLSGEALAGAIVFISGTSFADTTDASGSYRISAVPAGRYVVSFMHPELRALGIIPTPRRVDLAPAASASADLAIPALPTLIEKYCPSLEAGEGRGVLVGYVRDDRTGDPLPRARVRVAWVADSRLRAGSVARGVTRGGDIEANVDNAWIDATDASVEVSADDSGFFRACGLPLESSLQLQIEAGSTSARRTARMGRDPLSVQDLTVRAR